MTAAPAVNLFEGAVKRALATGVFVIADFACLAEGFLGVEVIAQIALGEPSIESVSSAENKTL